MRSSKVVFIQAISKKVRLYRGRLDCYFMDKEEAFQHRNGHDWREALFLITGNGWAPYMTHGMATYPIYSKEFRGYLDLPADPG